MGVDLLGLDDALAGDLIEERTRGRSTLWYWRQVLSAVWTGIWSAVFAHKVLALRAVAVGCAANGVQLVLWTKFLHLGLSWSPPHTQEEIIASGASLLIILLTQTATGWIVSRTHRAAAIPMVVLFAAWLTLWFLNNNFSGGRRLLLNPTDQPGFPAYLVWRLTPIAVEIVGLLLGGFLGSCPRSVNRLQPS